MKEIYLDNAATTRCDPDAAERMAKLFTEDYGNASSAHRKGYDAELMLRKATETIAKTLKCKRQEILYTSGGTESDNLALFGAARAYARKGKRIITTAIEHPAVTESVKALAAEGFDVVFLPVDRRGIVRMDALEDALTKETILVSVMAVNNETGSVQPLAEIGAMRRARAPEALFHTDAVQGYGKIPIDPRAAGIDLLSASGHKFHGPKGTGFLYVREGVRLQPLLYGGGQQRGLRSGTENVPGCCGMAVAAENAFAAFAEDTARMYALRAALIGCVYEAVPDILVSGGDASLRDDGVFAVTRACVSADGRDARGVIVTAPQTISLSVRGVRAEVLLHALEDKGIYVSAGSACATHHPGLSGALTAIGLEKELLESTIRISLSRETTEEEITETVEALRELVPLLRRYQPG